MPNTTVAAPHSTREHRMYVVLLAACDPCMHVDNGKSAATYSALSTAVMERLGVRGCHPADILELFPPDADASRVLQFCHAALDWWRAQRDAMSRTAFAL